MPQQSPLSEAALMSRVPLVMVIQSSQAIPLQELSPLTEMSRDPSPPIVRLPRAWTPSFMPVPPMALSPVSTSSRSASA